MTRLNIGTVPGSPETAAELILSKFNRHTFWCGQSGSGKTYALGVLLEQLLIHSSLPMVILDPNADFVNMAKLVSDSPSGSGDAIAARNIRVLDPAGDDPLRVRFLTLPLATKAAILRIDPLLDGDEYNALLHLEEFLDVRDPRGIQTLLYESKEDVHHRLARRIENLGLLTWGIWAFDREPATEIVAERPDATVVNLGGFEHPEEPMVVALSILQDLWARRAERRPILIVIDEAHNFCSPELETSLAQEVRAQIIRIAAEGRKYGLWLLLSTQRPSRIHPSILSQCDNLALMRMGSPLDLAELLKIFGFAPDELVLQSPTFPQGRALFGGGFIEEAGIVQMGARLTQEGGADVKVPVRAL